jgi:hypothetical protein
MPDADPLVAVQGAADLCGMTERQIRGAVAAGKLIPEGTVANTAVWRTSTILRWDLNGRHTTPISPSLDVLGVSELADRWHISVDLVRKMRANGQLPAPDHIVGEEGEGRHPLVWELASIQKVDPLCDGCGLPIDAVDSCHTNGKQVQLQCSCSRWSPMKLREVA